MSDPWTSYTFGDRWTSETDWGKDDPLIGSLIAAHGPLSAQMHLWYDTVREGDGPGSSGIYRILMAFEIDAHAVYFADEDDDRGLFMSGLVVTLAPDTPNQSLVGVISQSELPQNQSGQTTVTDTSGWSAGANAGAMGGEPMGGVDANYSRSTSTTKVIQDLSTDMTSGNQEGRANKRIWRMTTPSDLYWSEVAPVPGCGVSQPASIARTLVSPAVEVAFEVDDLYFADGRETLNVEYTLACELTRITSCFHKEEYSGFAAGAPFGGIVGSAIGGAIGLATRAIRYHDVTPPFTHDTTKGLIQHNGILAIPRIPPQAA